MENIDKNILQRANVWLNGNYDAETKKQVKHLLENDATELVDSFYRDLEFGTGGLRGIMGVGTNRMNKYTVSMATQGLANYLTQQFPNQKIKVAIAFDSRNNSQYFASISAEVLSANNIYVYLFDELKPTPELSFAIRQLHCQSGIVITASHNPKEYNGYKVYWNDGGQLINPHDKNVIVEVLKIKSIDEVKMNKVASNIEIIGKEIDEVYIKALKAWSLSPEVIAKHKQMKIVYTPIHGTGVKLVPDALKAYGFENISLVEEQSIPDGNFPTVHSPNPEESAALSLAVKKAESIGADLVMATDPDADRVGIAVRNNKNEFELLNGNQTATLLTYYALNKWKENGKINGSQFIVKTIVTTELLVDLANYYKVESFDVLTGFKYIADIIKQMEGKKTFICGGEESYGFLVGDHARDKDAVIACAMVAEAAAWAKEQGKSLYNLLIDIYTQFGFYKESLVSLTKKGKNGLEEIEQMMVNYRNNPPKEIDATKVVMIKDYQLQKTFDFKNNAEHKIDLPKSNVLQFFLEDGSKITVRPSGTEPKIKFYFGIKGSLASKDKFEEANQIMDAKLKRIVESMNLK